MLTMLQAVKKEIRKRASKEKAKILRSFFKTGPGQYGEGDVFVGVKVPEIRAVVKQFSFLALSETNDLLQSPVHEDRLCALLMLVRQYQMNPADRPAIYTLYLQNTEYVNNWDLVDVSAEHIVGAFLWDKGRQPLYSLARSSKLWERRISIVSTFYYIKKKAFYDTVKIAEILLRDEHDLIHKSVGWMLREIGKREISVLEDFLKAHGQVMPRTMLRYAIEKFPEAQRQAYLKGKYTK